MLNVELYKKIRHFLSYGPPDDVSEVEQNANILMGGIVDGETHADFKDRAARKLTELLALLPR